MYAKAAVSLLVCCVAGTFLIALSQQQPNVQNSIIVSIPAEGEFYLGKQKIAQADLREKLEQLLKDRPPDEETAYIKARDSVRYGTVVVVMNAMREVGLNRIGLVSEKKKDNRAKPSLSNIKPADIATRPGNLTSSMVGITIVIEVKSRTRLKLNSKRVPLSRLETQLKEMLDGRSDKTIFIRAPRTLRYGDVKKVIDLAKAAGAGPIGLQIDQLD